MPVDAPQTRQAREEENMARQRGSHMVPDGQPDARAMGAESAEFTKPTIDPQWMDAWKLFLDREGREYGVPVRLPRGQWTAGGPNALVNLRRPDGGYWFTTARPDRVLPEPEYECFVGDCRKRLHKRIQVVDHVRTFHFAEAKAHKAILEKIEQQVAAEDPRLQRLLAGIERPAAEFDAGADQPVVCLKCEAVSPEDHEDPTAWLRGHMLGAHKEGSPD